MSWISNWRNFLRTIFDKLDNLYNAAEKSLSPEQQKQLAKLDEKIVFFKVFIVNDILAKRTLYYDLKQQHLANLPLKILVDG